MGWLRRGVVCWVGLLAWVGAPGQEADAVTEGAVAGMHYRAVVGTLRVGSTDTVDALLGRNGRWLTDQGGKALAEQDVEAPATARVFYVAYFRTDLTGASAKARPVMFLYNGGPSTASLWLHMGAFGPRRVAIPDATHLSGPPYALVENQATLLDVADLVFIDAPGTGFSRVLGKDAQRAFWGMDEDAHAFERFIRRFVTKYDLWNHPKYLFGESYGTSRTALIAAALQNTDLSGVVMMSQLLVWDDSIDAVKGNPGVDQGYALELPSYAAAAWYHHVVTPQPAALGPWLKEVEGFAMGEYMAGLLKGSRLSEAERRGLAGRLEHYTGVKAQVWLENDLRVDVGVFDKSLLRERGLVAGRLDSRYTGPDLTPGSTDPGLDPMGLATGPAYWAAVNVYLTEELKYGQNDAYKYMLYDVPGFRWDWHHQGPGSPAPLFAYTGASTMLDLAFAMKRNPKMKVLLLGGYFDLGTPYFGAEYEMDHLPVPAALRANISEKFYETGHMIYLNADALGRLHDDVAAFVRATETPR